MSSNVTLGVSFVSAIISLTSLLVVFWNVNRTQKKNAKNDIEKFKRELGLKAADELIDCMIELNDCFQDATNLNTRWTMYLKDKISVGLLKQKITEMINGIHQHSLKLLAQHRKRELIYKKYDNELKSIYENSTKLNLNIMLFNARLYDGKLVGITDQEISKMIIDIENEAKTLLIALDILLKKVQNDFLGNIFK